MESMISQRVTEIHSVSDLETREALIPNAATFTNTNLLGKQKDITAA